jgi:GntR family transcriptional regulator, transcriptional repressor for pyruvate dehydrogenase complex
MMFIIIILRMIYMQQKDIFESQKKESTVDFIINNIKKLLLTKKLLPGDMLPSEMDLAERFNVSRGSIREAMKILSAFGIIEIKRGDGTYVARSLSKTLLDPFLFNLILSNADTREMVELRELIELQLVRLIIKNADNEDLNNIEAIHNEMRRLIVEQSEVDFDAILQYDLKFHDALGRATKNILVEKIYSFVMELFSPYIEKTYESEKNGIHAFKLHEDIINSLKSRDINKAMEATEKSIEEWRRRFENDN